MLLSEYQQLLPGVGHFLPLFLQPLANTTALGPSTPWSQPASRCCGHQGSCCIHRAPFIHSCFYRKYHHVCQGPLSCLLEIISTSVANHIDAYIRYCCHMSLGTEVMFAAKIYHLCWVSPLALDPVGFPSCAAW